LSVELRPKVQKFHQEIGIQDQNSLNSRRLMDGRHWGVAGRHGSCKPGLNLTPGEMI